MKKDLNNGRALRYLGSFYAILSLLYPEEQRYEKNSFADLISGPKSRNSLVVKISYIEPLCNCIHLHVNIQLIVVK